MPEWPQAIFFDFDGVIVNSEPLHCAAFRKVLADENIDLSEAEYYRELIGFDDRGAFTHIFSVHRRTLDADTFRRVLGNKRETVESMMKNGEFSALPGVDELVRGLSQHYPLAICSGALRNEIEMMLRGIGLRDCFPIIVAAEDVLIGKPNPEGYLLTRKLVAERTGLPLTPGDCLVIEDAPTVIRAVKSQGFKTLGVATSHPMGALREADFAAMDLHPSSLAKLIPQLKTARGL